MPSYDHICLLYLIMSCGALCVTLLTCRDVKKYKKDFMQSLSCSLLVMKRDNSIKHLRGPRNTELTGSGYGNASYIEGKEINQYS